MTPCGDGDIWTWARRFRRRELNIGVAPKQIAVELRGSLDTIRHRWRHTDDWTPRELGVAVHAETVRIHPFVDGMAGRRVCWRTSCSQWRKRSTCLTSMTGISTSLATSPCSANTTVTATRGNSPTSSASDRWVNNVGTPEQIAQDSRRLFLGDPTQSICMTSAASRMIRVKTEPRYVGNEFGRVGGRLGVKWSQDQILSARPRHATPAPPPNLAHELLGVGAAGR